jgi:hypothetical protein
MSSRGELVEHLEAAYKEFRSTLEGLDEIQFETKWLDGLWGVHEIVAHHTGWLGQRGGGLERMSKGEKPAPDGVDWTDVQHWNDTFAHHAMGKRQAEVLDELEHAFHAFEEAAAKLPDDRFGEGKTASKVFDLAGISHFKEHAAMIRSWREGRALKVWRRGRPSSAG